MIRLSPPPLSRGCTSAKGRRFWLVLLVGLSGASLIPPVAAAPVITEVMASNRSTIADEDGDYSDWVEIHNPDATAVALGGWYLTDTASNKTKWSFPAGVTIPAHGYLLVWASNKNRGSATTPPHTNFALSSGGEYVGLIQADGTTVVSEFAPGYPPLSDDTSYGVTQGEGDDAGRFGYFGRATPGTRNGGAATLITLGEVTFSRDSGIFQNSVTLEITGAGAGQVIRYVLAPPSPVGASVAPPDEDSPQYTGPLTITESTIVRAAVFTADTGLRGPVTTAHFARLADDLANFTSALPVVVLDSHGLGPMERDDIDRDGWLYVFTPEADVPARLQDAPELVTPMEFKVRGSSSALFPKKGYNVELKARSGGDDPQPLLGMPASEDWAFVAPWNYDRAFIRNALGYTLARQMGYWAPRTRFAEGFLNADGGSLTASDYQGIFIITERILFGSDRVNLEPPSPSATNEPEITGGYILKLDGRDPDEFGFRTNRGVPSFPESEFVVARPKAADLPEPHRAYLRHYIQVMEDTIYEEQAAGFTTRKYQDFIDVPSWIDLHLLNVFLSNADALLRSVYFTKAPGGKLIAGPVWDFDRSAGSADERTMNPETWQHTLADVWNHEWWGPLFRDPEFMQAWVDRWFELRRGPFATHRLHALIDQLGAEVGAEAAARDAARWPNNASPTGRGLAGELDHLKNWIERRAEWIDHQFLAPPSVQFANPDSILVPEPGTQIVYTLDGSDPRSSGGTPSATAQVSTGPLKLPDLTPFRARSQRLDPNVGVPGVAWSQPITLGDVRGHVQLINVSSRAIAGSGDNTLIAGIVVAGDEPARFLARAVGPTLSVHGVTSTAHNPIIRVLRSDGTVVAENTQWTDETSDTLRAVMDQVGAFPLEEGSRDAAVVADLAPGVYTMHITDLEQADGIALAELYHVEGSSRALNLSTRARVEAGQGQLIGGFAVRGDAPKRLLIRAVGPSLSRFGVTSVLADPVVTLHRDTEVLATVDNWEDSAELQDATLVAGAFALDPGSKDAALVVLLPPGNYTAAVSGANNSVGVALLEIYELP